MQTATFHRQATPLVLLALVACSSAASAEPPAASAATPSDAQAAGVDIKALDAEIAAAITVVSPTERTITPRGAQLLREHGAELVGTFRHIAEKQDGRPVGVRLFGIRSGSLAFKLGLENGDRVESILGTPLDTTEHIAAAFEAVKGTRSVDVTVSRRGTSLRIVTTEK